MRRNVRLAVTGALAGAANGFFGAGGGLFLVPLVTKWCGMEEKQAFATSVAVIFPLCALSAAVYYVRGGQPVSSSLGYLLGGAAGGGAAVVITKKRRKKREAEWAAQAAQPLVPPEKDEKK